MISNLLTTLNCNTSVCGVLHLTLALVSERKGKINHMGKSFLSVALICSVLCAFLCAPAHAANRFKDIQTSDWFCEAVNAAADSGIVNGTGDGMFSPNQQVTKLQFITMMTRLVYGSEIEETIKTIQNHDDWYEQRWLNTNHPNASFDNWWTVYMYYAQRNMTVYLELSDDEIDDLFNGKDAPCTRDMMAACIEWYLNEEVYYLDKEDEYNFQIVKATADSILANKGFIPDLENCTYKDSVALSVAAGIINGVDAQRTFNPSGIMTRGQACQVIYKILNKDKRTPITTRDVNQFLVDKSLDQVPSELRGFFDKSVKDLGIDTGASFEQVTSFDNNPLSGLYFHVKDKTTTGVGTFDDNKENTYYLEYKISGSTKYKVVSDHLLAEEASFTTHSYNDKLQKMVSETEYYAVYYIFAIRGDKLYMQRLANPARDVMSVNDVVYVYDIITAEQAEALKVGTFSISEAVGAWDCTSTTTSHTDTSIVITAQTSEFITIHGKTYACKALGNDRFELSADGKKAVYTIWLSKTMTSDPRHATKMICIRYDSDSLAGDILGIFSETDNQTLLFGNNGYNRAYYEIIGLGD